MCNGIVGHPTGNKVDRYGKNTKLIICKHAIIRTFAGDNGISIFNSLVIIYNIFFDHSFLKIYIPPTPTNILLCIHSGLLALCKSHFRWKAGLNSYAEKLTTHNTHTRTRIVRISNVQPQSVHITWTTWYISNEKKIALAQNISENFFPVKNRKKNRKKSII